MSRKHHPENERVKRRYLQWMQEAHGKSTATVDQAAAAINDFEATTGGRDFRRFHVELARQYRRALEDRLTERGQPLARATIHGRLKAVKAFFVWLADQPGYRSRISHADAAYFTPSDQDGRIARAEREKPTPTLAQIRHVLASMPQGTDSERRDRALIAFAVLTGMRDDAIASVCLGHVDLTARNVFQDARHVRTKARKTMTTWFFPVGEDAERIAADWIIHLRDARLFGPDDPLFPATEIGLDENGLFAASGLGRKAWSNAQPIRKAFRAAFEGAGLPYFHPHSFRRTLAQLGERVCRTPEEFKAWSQNLGHEQVLTTFSAYGAVAAHRQAEIIAGLRDRDDAAPAPGNDDVAALRRLLGRMEAQGAG